MSGDVQPRKRKDKRKKKEGSSLGNIHEPLGPQAKFRGKSFEKSFDEDSDTTPIIGSVDQGEKIHVHNDHGIGGNICVKIIFFCLLGALVTAVAVIFIHSRGSTDVDLPTLEESRFADYFTGWLDDAPDDHGHDEHEELHGDDDGHDEHDEEEDEHGGGDELSNEEHEDHDEEEGHEEEVLEEVVKEDEIEEQEEESPEADENEGDNADDSEEKENEDEADKGAEEEEDDDDAAPKFKVVHRFRHFFNKRKQFVNDKSEDVKVVKKKREFRKLKRVIIDSKDDDEEEEEEEEKEIKESEHDDEEDEEEEEKEAKESDHDDEEEDIEDEDEKVDVDEVDEEEDEDEEEIEEGEEKKLSLDSEDEDAADEDEEGDVEETDEEVEEEHEEEEEVEEVEEKTGPDGDEEESEELEEDMELAKQGDDDEEEDADEVSEEKPNVLADEEEEEEKSAQDDDEEDEETASADDDVVGLDEIDESEEALKEEERLTRGGKESTDEEKEESEPEEEEEESEEKTIGKVDVKDEEIEEVESKIMDIEEKLNKILREKRKMVEKRKLELEEIETGPTEEPKDDEQLEKQTKAETEEEGEEEEEETSSNGVVIKVLVGIALVIVAHMVLVQKWKAMGNVPADEKPQVETEGEKKDSEENETEPVISRRQTLVPETSDLNEYFADEIGGEYDEVVEDEEEEEEEEGDEGDEEEADEEDISEYSEEEVMIKDTKQWNVESPSRLMNLSKEEEEYAEEEDDLEDEEEYVEEEEEEIDDEEIEEEEEDVEEDDYEWKRLEPVKREEEPVVEDVPPVPPPRRSHMSSGERRGGPQGIDDDFTYDAFEELWEGVDSVDQGRNVEPEETGPEQEDKEEDVEKMDDDPFREDYKFAEDQLDNNPVAALKKYDAILAKKQDQIRALIGRAKALDRIAEKEKSNHYLKEAINNYKFVLTVHAHGLTDRQFIELSERCVERMRFGGYFKSAADIHKTLIRKFPNVPKYRNDLAVTYLFLNDIPSARNVLKETLKMWPGNGFALVHYGFILKTVDNNHAEAVDMLIAGIKTREPGVIDGRFFFHLGDALNRVGRGKEAMEWYEQGVKEKLFLNKYQRSLYNVNRLKGQPWWTQKETTYQDFFRKLEENWKKIRDEGLALLNGKGVDLFKQEAENLKDTGDWRQLDLYFRGRRHQNCDRAPFTCSLISSFQPASTCTRGQVKFSVMLPSTHVWPHCGPTNCRLRSHLGLVVPKNTFLRVAEETRSWEEGKILIFDDSFEHEVWHNGTSARLVLIVDVWHPELTAQERKYLSPI